METVAKTLYKHQEEIIRKMPKRILLAHSTGAGKTLSSIELIIKHTSHFLVVTKKDLKAMWVRVLKDRPEKLSFKVVTKEEFSRDWETLGYYAGVIIDESHYFYGTGSAMRKNMLKWLKKNNIPIRICCTATPYLSTPNNVYWAARILGYNWDWIAFQRKFFWQVKMGNRLIPQVKKGIEPEIARLVALIGDVVDMDEEVDVPEQTHTIEYFALNPLQKKMIAKISMEAVNPLTKFTGIHQAEQGTLKGTEAYTDTMIPISKDDYILKVAQENKKVAVFCRYNLQIDKIATLLKANQKQVFILRGDTPDRDAVVSSIEQSEECVVLINASCSEGYELPSIGTIIYASLSFSFKDLRQSQGRFLRINKLKENKYIYLLTKGGMDEDVYQNVAVKKANFDLAIYCKIK
jgi:hypothetical protein